MKNKNIILASSSPRRKEILTQAGYNIKIIPSNYEEKINDLKYEDTLVQNCAFEKALDVKKRFNSDELIVSADTVVVLNNVILGKPKDYNDAILMLENLSNKTHFVATSICLIKGENIIKAVNKTNVTFKEISKEEILNYLNTQKPFDKAGSYGIQDKNFNFVKSIDGDLNNVIGFPLSLFQELEKSI